MTILTETIKAEMAARRITQNDLANAIGITVSTINKKLNGRSDLTVREVECIATALGTDYFALTDIAKRREQLYAEKE